MLNMLNVHFKLFFQEENLFFCEEKSVADKYNQLLTADAKQDADLQNGCQTVHCYT